MCEQNKTTAKNGGPLFFTPSTVNIHCCWPANLFKIYGHREDKSWNKVGVWFAVGENGSTRERHQA